MALAILRYARTVFPATNLTQNRNIGTGISHCIFSTLAKGRIWSIPSDWRKFRASSARYIPRDLWRGFLLSPVCFLSKVEIEWRPLLRGRENQIFTSGDLYMRGRSERPDWCSVLCVGIIDPSLCFSKRRIIGIRSSAFGQLGLCPTEGYNSKWVTLIFSS